MILASLAFAVAAAVEIKINVSSINLKLHEGKTISCVLSSDSFNLDCLGPRTVPVLKRMRHNYLW